MRIVLVTFSGLLLLSDTYVVAMNWACVILSSRNRRKGIDRYHSSVPLVSLILTAVAAMLWPLEGKSWLFVLPALDLANWTILALPFQLLRELRKSSDR